MSSVNDWDKEGIDGRVADLQEWLGCCKDGYSIIHLVSQLKVFDYLTKME